MLDTLFTILDGIFSSSLFLTIWHWGIPIIIAISCLLAGMISKIPSHIMVLSTFQPTP